MSTPHDVSVIICAYSEARWPALLSAVESVRRQTVAPLELILVVDHNPSLFTRARRELSGVAVAENAEARGLSGARNTGVALARGAVVAFLDDDACAADDWLAQLLPGYDDPRVIGVGGAIVPRWAAGRPNWFPEEFDWVVGCTYRGLPPRPAPVRNLIGANMSLRRDVLERAGGFRSSLGRTAALPAGCEETELCIRARQQAPGAVLLYNPTARVSHSIPGERARWAYFRARCFAEGRSKALVSRLVGAADGLASERAYVRQTLPRAIWRGLRDALARRDGAGLAGAGAIVAGTLITTAGYLSGWLAARRQPAPRIVPRPQPDDGLALARQRD